MSGKGPLPYGVNGSRYSAIDHAAIEKREQKKLELIQQRIQASNNTLKRIEKVKKKKLAIKRLASCFWIIPSLSV